MKIAPWVDNDDLPLAVRIKRLAFGMTMLIVLALGCLLLAQALIDIPANQTGANRNAVSVIGEIMSGDIRNRLSNLRRLSRNPLVWTALTDSIGRDAYLKPFMQNAEKDSDDIPMQLLDYRGRRVLGDLPPAIDEAQLGQLVAKVLHDKQARLAVAMDDGQPVLLAVFPVPFPYTQDAIGALAGMINLSDMLRRRSAGLGQDTGVDIVHRTQAIVVHPGLASSGFFPATFDLAFGENTEGGATTLRLYSTRNPWLQPIAERVFLSALFAALLGIPLWQISGAIARRITQRLDLLADACATVSDGRAATFPEDSAKDEIGVLSRTLRLAFDALETSNKDLEEFSYSMSHEMRTPLRALDGFSTILLQEYAPSLDDEGKRLLNVLRDNAQRMGRLIDDILHYLSLGRLKMEFSAIDIADLASEIVAELQATAPARRVRLDIGALAPAWGDCNMIREALQNLLSNAVKFSRTDCEALIEIRYAANQGENVYAIRDHGVGFDMRYADKLFKVFERVHQTGQYEGSGIGLALVKRIVTRHGGRVWAEGNVNQGATIYFALPTRETSH